MKLTNGIFFSAALTFFFFFPAIPNIKPGKKKKNKQKQIHTYNTNNNKKTLPFEGSSFHYI